MDSLSYGSLYIDGLTFPVPICPTRVSSDDKFPVKAILRQPMAAV